MNDYLKSVFARPLGWALVLVVLVAGCAATSGERDGAQRIYVLYCGEGNAPDMARWTPGVEANKGKPILLTNSCYLIKHAKGWMLWETGYAESLASMPNGNPTAVLHWRWRGPKTLTAQLAELGIAPDQINFVGFSHAHPDHYRQRQPFYQGDALHPGGGIQLLPGPQRETAFSASELEQAARQSNGQAEWRLRRVR